MLLAQGLFWKATLRKAAGTVVLTLVRESLPEDVRDLRELKVDIPLEKWNRMLKHVRTDRKLAGGILLDFANQKDQVSAAVSSDRLFGELQRVVLEATACLVERGHLTLTVAGVGAD